MEQVAIIANEHMYGLIIISVYYREYVLRSRMVRNQALDVRFPDVTKKGQGMHLASYTENHALQGVTLWNMLGGAEEISVK